MFDLLCRTRSLHSEHIIAVLTPTENIHCKRSVFGYVECGTLTGIVDLGPNQWKEQEPGEGGETDHASAGMREAGMSPARSEV